jgi:hypothetical protein
MRKIGNPSKKEKNRERELRKTSVGARCNL